MERTPHIKLAAPVLALLLLLAAGAEALTRPRAADAEPYHANVKKVALDEIPLSYRDWNGEESPVTKSAVELLKPNVIYSRKYKDGRHVVSVMIVHCKDSRDIDGHYPAICYPANGWEGLSQHPMKAQVGGLDITGIAYEFEKRTPESAEYMYIDNFILMPNGRIVPDMSAVKRQSADFMTRFHGAANVQVVFYDPKLTPAERDAFFTDMVQLHMPLIKAILAGVSKSAGAKS